MSIQKNEPTFANICQHLERILPDLGVRVYACTCSFSLFAYIWLYFVLGVATPHCVTLAGPQQQANN